MAAQPVVWLTKQNPAVLTEADLVWAREQREAEREAAERNYGLAEARRYGVIARNAGKPLESNPWHGTTVPHFAEDRDAWAEGWHSAEPPADKLAREIEREAKRLKLDKRNAKR
jgi:hypothetical protein